MKETGQDAEAHIVIQHNNCFSSVLVIRYIFKGISFVALVSIASQTDMVSARYEEEDTQDHDGPQTIVVLAGDVTGEDERSHAQEGGAEEEENGCYGDGSPWDLNRALLELYKGENYRYESETCFKILKCLHCITI